MVFLNLQNLGCTGMPLGSRDKYVSLFVYIYKRVCMCKTLWNAIRTTHKAHIHDCWRYPDNNFNGRSEEGESF